jgi:long-chain-fatty-acid---luciferin-component ligase
MLAIECAHHHKHVPPWCHVSIRDVADPAKEVPEGSRGLIAILDGLNTSYPAFVLTEDVGVRSEGSCACGRRGQMVTFTGRLKGADVGCCAVSIERRLGTVDPPREARPACDGPGRPSGVSHRAEGFRP